MYSSFLNSRSSKFHVVPGACFHVIFLSISKSKFRRSGFPNRGFRKESIAKIDFSWKSFLIHFTIDLCHFLEALGTVFFIFLIPRGTISASQEHPRGVFRNLGGAPWGAMGATGWTRDASLQDFVRFWGDLVTCVF